MHADRTGARYLHNVQGISADRTYGNLIFIAEGVNRLKLPPGPPCVQLLVAGQVKLPILGVACRITVGDGSIRVQDLDSGSTAGVPAIQNPILSGRCGVSIQEVVIEGIIASIAFHKVVRFSTICNQRQFSGYKPGSQIHISVTALFQRLSRIVKSTAAPSAFICIRLPAGEEVGLAILRVGDRRHTFQLNIFLDGVLGFLSGIHRRLGSHLQPVLHRIFNRRSGAHKGHIAVHTRQLGLACAFLVLGPAAGIAQDDPVAYGIPVLCRRRLYGSLTEDVVLLRGLADRVALRVHIPVGNGVLRRRPLAGQVHIAVVACTQSRSGIIGLVSSPLSGLRIDLGLPSGEIISHPVGSRGQRQVRLDGIVEILMIRIGLSIPAPVVQLVGDRRLCGALQGHIAVLAGQAGIPGVFGIHCPGIRIAFGRLPGEPVSGNGRQILQLLITFDGVLAGVKLGSAVLVQELDVVGHRRPLSYQLHITVEARAQISTGLILLICFPAAGLLSELCLPVFELVAGSAGSLRQSQRGLDGVALGERKIMASFIIGLSIQTPVCQAVSLGHLGALQGHITVHTSQLCIRRILLSRDPVSGSRFNRPAIHIVGRNDLQRHQRIRAFDIVLMLGIRKELVTILIHIGDGVVHRFPHGVHIDILGSALNPLSHRPDAISEELVVALFLVLLPAGEGVAVAGSGGQGHAGRLGVRGMIPVVEFIHIHTSAVGVVVHMIDILNPVGRQLHIAEERGADLRGGTHGVGIADLPAGPAGHLGDDPLLCGVLFLGIGGAIRRAREVDLTAAELVGDGIDLRCAVGSHAAVQIEGDGVLTLLPLGFQNDRALIAVAILQTGDDVAHGPALCVRAQLLHLPAAEDIAVLSLGRIGEPVSKGGCVAVLLHGDRAIHKGDGIALCPLGHQIHIAGEFRSGSGVLVKGIRGPPGYAIQVHRILQLPAHEDQIAALGSRGGIQSDGGCAAHIGLQRVVHIVIRSCSVLLVIGNVVPGAPDCLEVHIAVHTRIHGAARVKPAAHRPCGGFLGARHLPPAEYRDAVIRSVLKFQRLHLGNDDGVIHGVHQGLGSFPGILHLDRIVHGVKERVVFLGLPHTVNHQGLLLLADFLGIGDLMHAVRLGGKGCVVARSVRRQIVAQEHIASHRRCLRSLQLGDRLGATFLIPVVLDRHIVLVHQLIQGVHGLILGTGFRVGKDIYRSRVLLDLEVDLPGTGAGYQLSADTGDMGGGDLNGVELLPVLGVIGPELQQDFTVGSGYDGVVIVVAVNGALLHAPVVRSQLNGNLLTGLLVVSPGGELPEHMVLLEGHDFRVGIQLGDLGDGAVLASGHQHRCHADGVLRSNSHLNLRGISAIAGRNRGGAFLQAHNVQNHGSVGARGPGYLNNFGIGQIVLNNAFLRQLAVAQSHRVGISNRSGTVVDIICQNHIQIILTLRQKIQSNVVLVAEQAIALGPAAVVHIGISLVLSHGRQEGIVPSQQLIVAAREAVLAVDGGAVFHGCNLGPAAARQTHPGHGRDGRPGGYHSGQL